MMSKINEITQKIERDYPALSHDEIREIVRQAAEEVEHKYDEKLARSVTGTD